MLVPMPDDEGKLTQALLNAVLLRKRQAIGQQAQIGFDFGEPAQQIETAWQSAREKAAKTAPSSPSADSSPTTCCPNGASLPPCSAAPKRCNASSPVRWLLGAGLEPYKNRFKARCDACQRH